MLGVPQSKNCVDVLTSDGKDDSDLTSDGEDDSDLDVMYKARTAWTSRSDWFSLS